MQSSSTPNLAMNGVVPEVLMTIDTSSGATQTATDTSVAMDSKAGLRKHCSGAVAVASAVAGIFLLLLATFIVVFVASGGDQMSPTPSRSQALSMNHDGQPYYVEINGKPANIHVHTSSRHIESNNFVQHTLQRSGDAKEIRVGYHPAEVVVTSLDWTAALGSSAHIRPSHLVTSGIVSDVSVTNGTVRFRVSTPCQLSVEIGDEDILFPDEQSLLHFANLILFIDPPKSEWAHTPPTLLPTDAGRLTNRTGNGSSLTAAQPTCVSVENHRSCVVAMPDESCAPLIVTANTDLYFPHSQQPERRLTPGTGNHGNLATHYIWGDGCGARPKTIRLQRGARVFLEEGTIVYARIASYDWQSIGAAVYGYGVLSNVFMCGEKINSHETSNVVDLYADDCTVHGITIVDSVYRNVQLGARGRLEWTKSFAWNSETDGVGFLSGGGRAEHNFFKVNDDVLKAYHPNTTYANSTIWHQDVGRAILFSWGNGNEDEPLDGSVRVLDTSIIHDKLGFRSASPIGGEALLASNPALGWQAGMIYYSSLIAALHSTSAPLGTAASPILIDGLHVEGRIGSLLHLATGYAQLNGKAEWMDVNGCAGSIHLHLKGIDISRVTSMAAPSVVGGCNIDSRDGRVANGECICTTARGCDTEPQTQCTVDVTMDGFRDIDSSNMGTLSLNSQLVVGEQTHVNWT